MVLSGSVYLLNNSRAPLLLSWGGRDCNWHHAVRAWGGQEQDSRFISGSRKGPNKAEGRVALAVPLSKSHKHDVAANSGPPLQGPTVPATGTC